MNVQALYELTKSSLFKKNPLILCILAGTKMKSVWTRFDALEDNKMRPFRIRLTDDSVSILLLRIKSKEFDDFSQWHQQRFHDRGR